MIGCVIHATYQWKSAILQIFESRILNLDSIFKSFFESSKFLNLDSIFELILLKNPIKNFDWTLKFWNESWILNHEKFWIGPALGYIHQWKLLKHICLPDVLNSLEKIFATSSATCILFIKWLLVHYDFHSRFHLW